MASSKNTEKQRPTTKMKVAYVIETQGDKKFWTKIGVAFVNNDGSINVKLSALPVNGEAQLRDFVEKEEAEGFGKDE